MDYIGKKYICHTLTRNFRRFRSASRTCQNDQDIINVHVTSLMPILQFIKIELLLNHLFIMSVLKTFLVLLSNLE